MRVARQESPGDAPSPGTPASRRPLPAWPEADGVELSTTAASPLAALGPGSLARYWRFQRAVAKAQLAAWLPRPRKLLVDISGPYASASAQAAERGHTVIRVVAATAAEPHPATGPDPAIGPHPATGTNTATGTNPPAAQRRAPGPRRARAAKTRPGAIVPVAAEPASLAFLSDGCADGVIAEDGALSRQLMTEDLAAEIMRVLRPGGYLLASVDSLVLGMAMLAEQHRWAHLTDLSQAEVVLIPWPDGTITRCFGLSQFTELLTEAGLEVGWVRPRTVLSPSMVDRVLRQDPTAIARLVRAELAAGQDRAGGILPAESFGISLVAAARKPGPA